MKLNLRSARKLDTNISNIIRDAEINQQSAIINVFNTESAETLIETAQIQVEDRVLYLLRLINIRSYVRRKIQIANEESGINDLISQRKFFLDELNIWAGMADRIPEIKTTPEILTGQISTKRENAGSGTYFKDTVVFVAISPQLEQTITTTLRTTKRKINNIDDKILELNMATKIILEEDVVPFLKKEGVL